MAAQPLMKCPPRIQQALGDQDLVDVALLEGGLEAMGIPGLHLTKEEISAKMAREIMELELPVVLFLIQGNPTHLVQKHGNVNGAEKLAATQQKHAGNRRVPGVPHPIMP